MNRTIPLFTIFLFCYCIAAPQLKAQLSHNVLFLGNSYTGVNNLPQLIHDVALSAGDTLNFDSYTPGGYRLIDHSQDVISQNKIMSGNWEYVVIQGQSQEPITNTGQFTNGGTALFNQVKQYNPCAVTMPYMTWGRKNGDASNCPFFPVMCTYQGMDTTIRNTYLDLTTIINGEVSPVSVVWNYIRQNSPGIELYDADESHPSAAGSYAAACSFYASIFKKDPTLITFDFGLNASDAATIRSAAKIKVFDVLPIWDFKKSPYSGIRYSTGTGNNEVLFNPVYQGIQQTYLWDFGDGNTSTVPHATHTYLNNGTYTVSLTTTTCDLQGTHTAYSDTILQLCSHTPSVYTALPWVCNYDTLWTQTADSYQWFAYGLPLPEYNQYLANYAAYGSAISVMATTNGCAELSAPFTDMPQWSGYFFDIMGTPCTGDTVAFAVLHMNGSLNGSENILWFKNDTLLPLMTNEDTLLISSSGKYESKVINPLSNCPLDTTSYTIVYNCSVSGIDVADEHFLVTIYPNPASEFISIQFAKFPAGKMIDIYTSIGALKSSIPVTASTMKINIADLDNGLYFIRLKNNKQPALKFIKINE